MGYIVYVREFNIMKTDEDLMCWTSFGNPFINHPRDNVTLHNLSSLLSIRKRETKFDASRRL